MSRFTSRSSAMKSFRTIAVGVLCLAVLCGAAILWRAHKQKAIEQKKLTDEASAYRARAEKGDAGAQYALAYMYYQGRGVPQDYHEAVRWARMAAEQGNAKAQFALGSAYQGGRGVPQDYLERPAAGMAKLPIRVMRKLRPR